MVSANNYTPSTTRPIALFLQRRLVLSYYTEPGVRLASEVLQQPKSETENYDEIIQQLVAEDLQVETGWRGLKTYSANINDQGDDE